MKNTTSSFLNFLPSAKQQICWMMNWFTDDAVEETLVRGRAPVHMSLHLLVLWLAVGSPSLTSHWLTTTLCVVSTPFLQNTIPCSCSGLERCSTNLHTSSSHIGSLDTAHCSDWPGLRTWLACWHDSSTKVATHYTTKSPEIVFRPLKSWICSFMFLSMNELFWRHYLSLWILFCSRNVPIKM